MHNPIMTEKGELEKVTDEIAGELSRGCLSSSALAIYPAQAISCHSAMNL
ncbi:MAG: hypothetical protein RML93_00590 [Anaerolineales bacterium]|nr:hypothetical protein [Anaerolineales bacterium]MCS7247920.1 hypothetical protein [Anaerolineales bacterium]MDW8161730.1 hypothetical protein [Anaerolineales bacterium]MDW8445768.1 hypothetical protein [Anaerolineales bacterium]